MLKDYGGARYTGSVLHISGSIGIIKEGNRVWCLYNNVVCMQMNIP